MATSASQHTPNANLSQFADNDKPTWLGDYNADMSKIDGEFAEQRTDINAASQNSTEAKATAASAVSAVNAEATARTNADKALDDKFDGISDAILESVEALETSTANRLGAVEEGLHARWTKTEADERFTIKGPKPRAVFIGSSNSTVGTWPETFSTERGWIAHNFSVGGGGFIAQGGGSMEAQAQSAIADKTYPHNEVKYVFMCDSGNDIRAQQWDVTMPASNTFRILRQEFPNARIIAIPALWGQTDPNEALQNTGTAVLTSLAARIAEISEAGRPFRVEVVPGTHTWHWDSAGWMLTRQVHYTPTGYRRIIDFMHIFMDGGDTWCDTAWLSATAMGASGIDVSGIKVRRNQNRVQIRGAFNNPTNVQPIDTDILVLPIGCRPIENVVITMQNSEAPRASLCSFQIWRTNGIGRSFAALAAGTWNLNGSFAAF